MTVLQLAAKELAPRSALLSPCETYRYELTRVWDASLLLVRWIMLNPSVADAKVDDPTLRRCIAYTRAWGFGGFVIHNLQALRATNPAELRRHPDPTGVWNDAVLLATRPTVLTIAAWGAHGALGGRDRRVITLLTRRGVALHHLGPLTKAGQPRHPLYLPANARLNAFRPLAASQPLAA